MRKIFFTLLLALLSTLLGALELSVNVTPSGILAGEFASLSITCDREGDMKFDLPEVKGIKWFRNSVSTSRSYSSVNGVTSIKITRSIHFTATEPGSYEIPSFKVTCGRESANTRSIKFSVVAPGSSPGSADNIPAAAEVVWPDTGKFYTGQWIPLEVILTIPDGMTVGNYSFPRLSGTENLIFFNYTVYIYNRIVRNIFFAAVIFGTTVKNSKNHSSKQNNKNFLKHSLFSPSQI
jgi:hypothetical protein